MHPEQPWFVLTAAKHYDFALSNDPVISHFYSFEVDQTNGLAFVVPDGCLDIVFDCDQRHPKAIVCGSTLQARNANLEHNHLYFGVRFALGVLPDFLNATAVELVENRFGLQDLTPQAENILSQISEQPEFIGKVAVFKRFYEGKLPRKISPLTFETASIIFEEKGNIRIKKLESLTGYTCRTLQRRFQEDIGMTPKDFGRIVRSQHAIYNIHNLEKITFSELAFDLGFSDQPHFLREFKKFVSTSPADYQRRIKQGDYLQRIRYFEPK